MAPAVFVGGFVPDIQLPSVPGGKPVKLRECGGKTTILVTVHSRRCAGCEQYIADVASLGHEFEVWDARLLVLVPGGISEADLFSAPCGTVLADEQSRLADGRFSSLIIADRYGQIFHAASAGESHDLPSVRELEEWLKYLGTLCPE